AYPALLGQLILAGRVGGAVGEVSHGGEAVRPVAVGPKDDLAALPGPGGFVLLPGAALVGEEQDDLGGPTAGAELVGDADAVVARVGGAALGRELRRRGPGQRDEQH